MALIKTIRDITPTIGEDTWLAENATITGDVTIGSQCSVWYHTVIRGDVNGIRIGNKVNIQDGSIIHGTTGGPDTIIEDEVNIGHNAILHGCVLRPQCLIGMGAIVLDLAIIESHALVAAGAVVSGGTVVESGYLYAGVPAKKIRKLTDQEIERYIFTINNGYLTLKNEQ